MRYDAPGVASSSKAGRSKNERSFGTMIRHRLRRVLHVLALASFPFAAAPSTVNDVVAALRANDGVRAQELLDTLRSRGLADTYEVRFLQGVLHLLSGEGEKAARAFDELEASEGPAPELASGQALSAWSAGRYGEARTRLERATRRWPEHSGVWATLSEVYRALSEHAQQQVRALNRDADAETPLSLGPPLSIRPRAPEPPSSPGTPTPASSRLPASPATTPDPATTAPAAPADSTASTGKAGPLPRPAAPSVASRDGVRPVPAAPPAPAASAGCFRAGPWTGAPPRTVVEWLPAHDARILSLPSSTPFPYHRVYLGPFESRKQAEERMASLRRLGVRDMARITTGQLHNAVSLGVYTKRENVDQRVRALRALGVEPRIRAPRTESWLHGMASDFQALAVEWSRDFPDVSLAPERCPSPSS